MRFLDQPPLKREKEQNPATNFLTFSETTRIYSYHHLMWPLVVHAVFMRVDTKLVKLISKSETWYETFSSLSRAGTYLGHLQIIVCTNIGFYKVSGVSSWLIIMLWSLLVLKVAKIIFSAEQMEMQVSPDHMKIASADNHGVQDGNQLKVSGAGTSYQMEVFNSILGNDFVMTDSYDELHTGGYSWDSPRSLGPQGFEWSTSRLTRGMVLFDTKISSTWCCFFIIVLFIIIIFVAIVSRCFVISHDISLLVQGCNVEEMFPHLLI